MWLWNFVSDAYLKHFVKNKIKQWYAAQGLKVPELERKTLHELVNMVSGLIDVQKDMIELQSDKYNNLDKLAFEQSQVIGRQDNYIKTLEEEKKQSRSMLVNDICIDPVSELDSESEKHMSKLQQCRDEKEIFLEMNRHLDTEHAIKKKHLSHSFETKTQGIDLSR